MGGSWERHGRGGGELRDKVVPVSEPDSVLMKTHWAVAGSDRSFQKNIFYFTAILNGFLGRQGEFTEYVAFLNTKME